MVKKLKVAICLVGILRDKSAVPGYIKEMFTKIGNDHNIEFDYYCHFWNNDKLYPYYIIDDWQGTTLPKEDDASVQQVIDALHPKAVTCNTYNDMRDLYLHHGSNHQVNHSEYLNLLYRKFVNCVNNLRKAVFLINTLNYLVIRSMVKRVKALRGSPLLIRVICEVSK